MTDRQPGAPGQYKMTVSALEAQKLLAGEEVTVTLTRDDQPLVEGTPYNKASVLPDDLAAQICPGVTDPTPADAFRGVAAKRLSATLNASSWSGSTAPYKITLGLSSILATDRPHISPVYSDILATAIAQKEAWAAVSRAYTEDGRIIFLCFEDKPSTNIPIQIEVNR